MRTPILTAVFLGLTTIGCVGVIDSGPSGGGGGGGAGGGGEGGGGGGGGGSNPTPMIAGSIDKSAVQTELNLTEMLTVTITASMGFTGDVTLTPTVVDAQNAPVTGWMPTVTPAKLTFTQDGPQTAQVMVKIPTDTAALAATVKIDATSSAGPASVSSAFTVAQKLHLAFDAGTGGTVPHAHNPAIPMNMTVKSGTQVIWTNNDTIDHQVHGSNGIPHEPNAMAPGGTYTVTMTTASGDGQWYCHAHGETAGTRQIQVVP